MLHPEAGDAGGLPGLAVGASSALHEADGVSLGGQLCCAAAGTGGLAWGSGLLSLCPCSMKVAEAHTGEPWFLSAFMLSPVKWVSAWCPPWHGWAGSVGTELPELLGLSEKSRCGPVSRAFL